MVLPRLIVDLTNDTKLRHEDGKHGIALYCICGNEIHISFAMVYCPRCKTNYIIEGARFCPHPECGKLIAYFSYYNKQEKNK